MENDNVEENTNEKAMKTITKLLRFSFSNLDVIDFVQQLGALHEAVK